MKKLLILTLILIVSFISMSFRGCNIFKYENGILDKLSSGQLYFKTDGLETEKYSIYAGENGRIYRSINDNNNIIFEQKVSGTTQRLNDVRVTPSLYEQTVLAVGNNGAITRSTNTGNTWTASTPVTSSNLYGAEFNNYYDYAVGDNGTIVYSYDEGVTWFQVPSSTTRNLKAISLSNQFGSNLVSVGEKGAIVRSANSGQNWINVSLADTTVNFYDITKRGLYYIDGNKFCIIGSGGRIYKSTDGGTTWVQKPSGTTNTLRSIYQHTADSIVVVGDNGTIRFSTNGGETWFTDSYFNSSSTRNFKAVSLVNLDNKTYSALSDSLFFVSNEPLTLGLNNINTAIPQTMRLHQNYPNPFNPATKIGFNLPKGSFAKLTVYDITGREIKTLVNENLHAGTYEYEWNGINLPSGVYFYKLTAENFTETRRMVLVK